MTTILIVEDEMAIREDIVLILELEGYEAICADNGKTALKKLSENAVDIILCDIFMPIMDGYVLFATLQTDDNYGMIPFVFMSAKASEDKRGKDVDISAAAGYLKKPFMADTLLETLQNALS